MLESADRRLPSKQSKQNNNETNVKNNVYYKTTLYSSYESCKNLDSFSLYITVTDILNRICKTASKFERKFFKIVRLISERS